MNESVGMSVLELLKRAQRDEKNSHPLVFINVCRNSFASEHITLMVYFNSPFLSKDRVFLLMLFFVVVSYKSIYSGSSMQCV